MSHTGAPSCAEVMVRVAGFPGGETYLHLRLSEHEVLLFDLGPIGSKTLSQGAGFPCSHLSSRSSTRSLTYLVAFYSRFEEQTGIEIDLHLPGLLSIAPSSAGLS